MSILPEVNITLGEHYALEKKKRMENKHINIRNNNNLKEKKCDYIKIFFLYLTICLLIATMIILNIVLINNDLIFEVVAINIFFVILNCFLCCNTVGYHCATIDMYNHTNYLPYEEGDCCSICCLWEVL